MTTTTAASATLPAGMPPFALLASRAASSRSCLLAAYVESVRDVVSALSDTILFEAGGASEREVRRKADPAKASIERFLRDWKGSPLVSSQPSYAALVGAFRLSWETDRKPMKRLALH